MLSIIVPVKDEEEAISSFNERVVPILTNLQKGAIDDWEIIFVDDGSSDQTLLRIREAHETNRRIKFLSFSRNFGKEAALTAGLRFANGDAVVPMDVDLQDPPEVLSDMLARWQAGAEVVYGVRRSRQTDSLPKRLTADLYYRAHNRLSQDRIPEHAGDFRLLDRKVVDAINLLPERNRFMKGLFAWSGFAQDWVEYDREERRSGQTKFNYWRLWGLAIDGITSSSTLPLRVWSYIGVLIAVAAFLYAVILIADVLLSGRSVPGYASLMVALLLLSGIQLISLGVMGEYLGRTLTEVKQRPLFIVRQSGGFDS